MSIGMEMIFLASALSLVVIAVVIACTWFVHQEIEIIHNDLEEIRKTLRFLAGEEGDEG